ncbi:MAG: thiolase domain-containing protein, partial [Ilumatobacteraceae bacterium]
MTIRGAACIAGAYEHPRRVIPDRTVAQIHAEVAIGALADAGLSFSDVDAYFCAGDAPGLGGISMVEYLGMRNVRHLDSTETGGSSYLFHVSHAAQAIATGKSRVALVTLAGNPRSGGRPPGGGAGNASPESPFENPYGLSVPGLYALAAQRHMYEFGTTSAQLAEIRVAVSIHAQYNPHAFFRTPVTVDEVLASPMVSDPLRRLDCCVITDGGGALVVVHPDVARDLARPEVTIL